MSDAPRGTPLPERSAWRPMRADAVFLVLVLLGSGAGSLWLGQDLNFDLLSYHYCNGYAYSFGRLDRDVAAADWHTYINPVMDVVSIPAIIALLALAWPPSDARSPVAVGWRSGRLLLAGAACGAATGLRLTAAVDLVAVGVAVPLFGAIRRPFRAQVRALAALGVGGLLGFTATNGAWALRLWERFGNPIFPLANQLFRSPYFEPHLDSRERRQRAVRPHGRRSDRGAPRAAAVTVDLPCR